MTPEAVISGDAQWCVVTGDAVDLLSRLPNRSVTHIITDPPYLGARGSSWEKKEVPLNVPYAPATPNLLTQLVQQAERLIQRWFLCFNDYDGERLLRAELEQGDLLPCFQPIVWVKPPGAFTPNGSAYSVPKQVEFITAARVRRITGSPIPGAYVSPSYSPKKEILRTGGKPLSLMQSIIEDFTSEGDLILDPFCGAGTTGLAATLAGRRCIMFESDPEVAEACRERLQKADR